MAFTTVSNLSISPTQDQPRETPYFHPEDIAILLQQAGAKAVTLVNATIDTREVAVLIAVQDFTITDDAITITRLQSPQHFAALPCPPFNDQGGKHLTDPQAHPKAIINVPFIE